MSDVMSDEDEKDNRLRMMVVEHGFMVFWAEGRDVRVIVSGCVDFVPDWDWIERTCRA